MCLNLGITVVLDCLVFSMAFSIVCPKYLWDFQPTLHHFFISRLCLWSSIIAPLGCDLRAQRGLCLGYAPDLWMNNYIVKTTECHSEYFSWSCFSFLLPLILSLPTSLATSEHTVIFTNNSISFTEPY